MSQLSIQATSSNRLVSLEKGIWNYIQRHFELSEAIPFILRETAASVFLTGGAIRCALLMPDRYTDVDLIVRDPSDEIGACFDALILSTFR